MKIFSKAALIAASSLTLLGAGAQAATLSVPMDGELLLGFIASSGTGSVSNLEVDLGSLSQFTSAAPGSTLTLGNLSAQDLRNVYGDGSATNNASWNTRLDLSFGAIGTTGRPGNGGNYTILASEPEITPGTPFTPHYTFSSTGASALSISVIEPVANLMNGMTSTANSNFSTVIGNAAQPASSTGGSWTFQDHFTANQSFRLFNPEVDNPVGNVVPVSPTNPVAFAVSDLYEISPTVHSLDLGKLELFSDGTLKFIATPVPEPSSIGLMGVGFLSLIGMVVLRRRRSLLA